MEDIENAIRHAVLAGKLRSYVRRKGETGLAGLLRLADRHSAISRDRLASATGDGERTPAPDTARGRGSW